MSKTQQETTIAPTRKTISVEIYKTVCGEYEATIADLRAQIDALSKKKAKAPPREYKYVEETCYCGAKYNKSTRARHQKTKKHRKWVKANPDCPRNIEKAKEVFQSTIAPPKQQNEVDESEAEGDEGEESVCESESESESEEEGDE